MRKDVFEFLGFRENGETKRVRGGKEVPNRAASRLPG